MSFFKKLFRKSSPPPSFQQDFEELLTYELDKNYDHFTPFIQAHKSVAHFNYNLAVAWAISLIEEGKETPNVLMLASFGGQIDAFEIKPYITLVLSDFGLEELESDAAVLAVIRYCATNILLSRNISDNLRMLSELYMQYYEENFELNAFYLLECAWDDIESGYETYYYNGANASNIESLIKKEAANWLALNAEKSVPLK